MFRIDFIGEPFSHQQEALLLGSIRDDGMEEQFWASTTFWSRQAYEAQWREGIRRALNGMPSALITSMRNPETANFIEWWLLYPSGEQITLRNQILFLDRLVIPFQQDDPYRHIAEYKAHSGDGDPVSEWHVTRGSLQSYLTKSAPT